VARLEAIAKALYYPTPERVIDLIGDVVQLTNSTGSTLLDPCAGEGHAAARLARRWDVNSYGIELHKGRAAIAAGQLKWAKHGSYHQLTAISDKNKPLSPDGYSVDPAARPFGTLFLNPPYDEGTDENGASLRQEIEFLRATTRFLALGGLLIFIPPRKILRVEAFRECMRRSYHDIRVYAFSAPEVEDFDQVVVFARRYAYGNSYSDLSVFDETLVPLDAAAERYAISVPIVETRVALVGRAPEAYEPEENGGAWAAQQWVAHTGEGAEHELAPLVAPRPGHQAMLLAAGALNGLELDASGNALLVKGGSRKVISVVEGQGETIHRERITSYLSVLNLASGDLDSWQVEDDQTKTGDWFKLHGNELAAGILAAHAPQFGPGALDAHDFSKLRAPGILPGRSEPEILQIQREASAAVVLRWFGGPGPSRRRRGHKAVILCGEMGVGKTTMAIVSTELARARKVVIVCPTHLVLKWSREIETITGRRGAAMIPKKLSDVDAFFESTKATYLVLSKETAKLGARWESACAKGSAVVTREVRTTEGSSYYSMRTTNKMVAERRTFNACPACGAEVVLDTKAQSKCSTCLEPLYQFTTISTKGTKRWPLAAYIHDRYARRYTLVVDEAHQHAKGETDQARAVHQIITGARKVLMMTGTLYGGRASSIFHLLFRLDPAFRRAYKQTDCPTFVEHHGLFETVYKEEERTSTYGYRKGNSGGRIREIPGMSPAMIPMLLPYTVFVKLRDLRLELPEYTEEVILVDHNPKVLSAVSKFQGELKALIRKHPNVLGAYLQACLGYPDRPDQEEKIYDVDEEGNHTDLLAWLPAIDGTLWPKDEALIELVQKEHADGRKVLVFFTQTTRRDARPRVRAALEAKGLRVVQLDSNVAPEKREEWVRKQCEVGFDVMLTNGRLVETGLDLLFANTIVQYGIEYSINTLRQSIRRSWRLGQNRRVRVVFLAYRGTMQATATNLIARKMRAAELVDGDASGGLAQFDVGGGNFLLELAHEVLETHASRHAS
jgi:16S rRNA G966 N2-methylase RsmD